MSGSLEQVPCSARAEKVRPESQKIADGRRGRDSETQHTGARMLHMLKEAEKLPASVPCIAPLWLK